MLGADCVNYEIQFASNMTTLLQTPLIDLFIYNNQAIYEASTFVFTLSVSLFLTIPFRLDGQTWLQLLTVSLNINTNIAIAFEDKSDCQSNIKAFWWHLGPLQFNKHIKGHLVKYAFP